MAPVPNSAWRGWVGMDWLAFGIGALGALAPEILRLYRLRSEPSPRLITVFYVVVSVLFAVLGGALAVLIGSPTLWGAFYTGVAAPLIITKGAQVVDRGHATADARPEDEEAATVLSGGDGSVNPLRRFFAAL